MTNVPVNQVIFAHGMESGPWGTKILALAEIAKEFGWSVDSPDFSHTKDPDERVVHLLSQPIEPAGKLIVVGSSMGGYVAAHAASIMKPDGLFLMAPALYFPGYDREPTHTPKHSLVVHGIDDEVVPVDRAKRYAATRRVELHLIEDGHRLINRLPLICDLFRDFVKRVEASR